MKILRYLPYILCFVLFSCEDNEEYDNHAKLMLTKSYGRVAPGSGNFSIKVASNTKWSYQTDAGWISRLDRLNDSTLHVSYQSNEQSESRIASIRFFSGSVSKVFMLEQEQLFDSTLSTALPSELLDYLGSDSLYVLSPTILISKKGRYASTVTKADFSSTLLGWSMKSINPILLQMGITMDRSNLKMFYVDLPSTFSLENNFYIYGNSCKSASNGPFYVTDDRGNRLTDHQGRDSTMTMPCQAYRILIGKNVDEVPNPGGVACCWTGKMQISRSIVLNEGASSNVLAHEIGHTIGLEHTDQDGDACSYDQATKYLMRSMSYPDSQLLKLCENRISTSRSIFNTKGIKAFVAFERKYPSARAITRKKIGEIGASSIFDVSTGWSYITNPSRRREYIRNITYYTHNRWHQASGQKILCTHDIHRKTTL